MIVTRFMFCKGYKMVALSLHRNIQTTQVLALRVSDNEPGRKGEGRLSRRVGRTSRSLLLRQRLMKDSDFVDVNNENSEHDRNPSPEFLVEAYDQQIREFKDKTKETRRIMMKKIFAKRPKEPNMLTFNERQHIKFLHTSDPVEWTAEHLSQSFPALPWVINKILRNKWIPEDEEKIKMKDAAVLENWKKLKENKLEASQELLDHLKKFIDKRDNLEIQLKNPKFFQLPERKKKLEWKSGDFNSILLKYEKEVESLKGNPASVKALPENTTYPVGAIEKLMEPVTVSKSEKCEKSLLLDQGMKANPKLEKRKRENQVTLHELKEEIFQRAEKEDRLMSPLEEVIVQKTLAKHDQSEIFKSDSSCRRISLEENQIKYPEMNSTLSNGTGDKVPGEGDMKVGRESGGRTGRRREILPTEKENFYEEADKSEIYPNICNITELGKKLFGARDERETEALVINADEKKNAVVETKADKTTKPINYFNTEKDKEIYEGREKILSATIFWNSQNSRTRSLDAGFNTVGTVASPHIASHIKTYFTYDYPLKIKIPENKREKGKLYRVKDCYYDDSGKFLYRVPGMTE